MRIAFMGTPEFAVPTLDRLVADGLDVVAVYTQPPRRAGRGKAIVQTPVHRRAEALGLAVRAPENLREKTDRDAFAALDLDAAIVAAYGLILPPPVLTAPRFGCLNVHASLLPRWRGAAPIHRAILAGDDETGITIMDMERGLDTGPVRLVRRTQVDNKTAGELTVELATMGAAAMSQVLGALHRYLPVPQREADATYAAKIEKHDARILFSQDARTAERQVRAFAPVPGAFFEFHGERIRVLAAEICSDKSHPGKVLDDRLTIACENGSLRPILVQRAGRGVMTTAELLRGFPIPAGTQLS